MSGDDQEGIYCTVCGGIVPERIKIKRIPIDGKETGIDRLDWILLDVANMNLSSEEEIVDEILKRVRRFNYVPSKRERAYREAFLREYRRIPPFEKRERTLRA
ncbi:MAG: NAC family transcription factor [Methanospirillum sp.]|nr:NAC family transcription factor [Methanospirillum sp.]